MKKQLKFMNLGKSKKKELILILKALITEKTLALIIMINRN